MSYSTSTMKVLMWWSCEHNWPLCPCAISSHSSMFSFLCDAVLSRTFLCVCVCVFFIFREQDMGQNVETHFQEVLAALEQNAEESGRGGRGSLQARLQQLYSQITDAGTTSLQRRAVEIKGQVAFLTRGRLCDSSRRKRKRKTHAHTHASAHARWKPQAHRAMRLTGIKR